MLVEKQELKLLESWMKIWRKSSHCKTGNLPKRVFSTTIYNRAMKRGTRTQEANTNTPAKIQGHAPFILPFTLHMWCSRSSIQNVNVDI